LTKCIILGAGASYGYNDHLREIEKPPLTNEIFSKGMALGLFSQDDYPNLYEQLKHYSQIPDNPWKEQQIKQMDVEKFLQWLGDKLNKVKHEVNSSQTDFSSRVQEGISLSSALAKCGIFCLL
jgi:hypothetical protein